MLSQNSNECNTILLYTSHKKPEEGGTTKALLKNITLKTCWLLMYYRSVVWLDLKSEHNSLSATSLYELSISVDNLSFQLG